MTTLNKVESGEPLVIPAKTFNTFIDLPMITPTGDEDQFKNKVAVPAGGR